MITIQRLTLDQVEQGMILAQDVCTGKGTCLLPQGTVITNAMIAALRRREIDYVMVAMEELLTLEQSAQLEADIKARIERLFENTDPDPIMLKLRAVLLQYRLNELNRVNLPALLD